MGEVIHKAPVLFDGTRKWERTNIIIVREIFDEGRREKRAHRLNVSSEYSVIWAW